MPAARSSGRPGRLSADDIAYLGSLPETTEIPGAVLVHGSLPEPMDYLTNTEDALDCFDAFGGALCFIGHTHVAEYYQRPDDARVCQQTGLYRGGDIKLRRDQRYILNCGSVGQPRDGNPRASFGIYDSEAKTVKVKRVAYDIGPPSRRRCTRWDCRGTWRNAPPRRLASGVWLPCRPEDYAPLPRLCLPPPRPVPLSSSSVCIGG